MKDSLEKKILTPLGNGSTFLGENLFFSGDEVQPATSLNSFSI